MSDTRNDIYFGLLDAFNARPRESLGQSAKRMVNTRGPQITAAHVVMSVGDRKGDAQWAVLARAKRVADGCRWPR